LKFHDVETSHFAFQRFDAMIVFLFSAFFLTFLLSYFLSFIFNSNANKSERSKKEDETFKRKKRENKEGKTRQGPEQLFIDELHLRF